MPDGGVIESFDGRLLVQQEPDASSFPNGEFATPSRLRLHGLGPGFPAFINNRTLCIPRYSWLIREALDFKTPMLKALAMIDHCRGYSVFR
ncbi:MAG: glutamine synthetase III [Butyricimonas faecalis]